MKITPQRTSKFIIGSIDNEDGEVEKCTSKAVLGSSSQMDSNNSFQLLGCVASSTDKSPRSLRECEELLKEVVRFLEEFFVLLVIIDSFYISYVVKFYIKLEPIFEK